MGARHWDGGAAARTTSRVLVGLGVVLVAWAVPLGVLVARADGGGVGPGIFGGAVLAISGGAVVVLTLASSSVRVRVDDDGVHVVSGVVSGRWGGPSWSWRREELVSAEVEHVRPAVYGGLGLRRTPSRQAVVVRSGPGLRLTPREGTPLVVTVDDPEGAVAALDLPAPLR